MVMSGSLFPSPRRNPSLTSFTVWTTVKAAEMEIIRSCALLLLARNTTDIYQLDTMASPGRRRQRHPYGQDARTSPVGRWSHEHGR